MSGHRCNRHDVFETASKIPANPPLAVTSALEFGQCYEIGPCGTSGGMRITIEELLALNLSEQAWKRNLPPTLAEIARSIGVEATLRLALHYGGSNVYLPAWASDREGCVPTDAAKWGVTKVIGEEAAIKLVDTFAAGFTVVLTVPASLHGNVYRRLIAVAMFEKGASIRDVCQSVGVGRSQAYEWKRTFVAPTSQSVNPEAASKPSDNLKIEASSKAAGSVSRILRPIGAYCP